MTTDAFLKLKIERDLLRVTLINLYNVVESGDWYPDCDVAPDRQTMQILYKNAFDACNTAERVIAETYHEPV